MPVPYSSEMDLMSRIGLRSIQESGYGFLGRLCISPINSSYYDLRGLTEVDDRDPNKVESGEEKVSTAL